MTKHSRRGTHPSRDGKTVGTTLRLEKELLDVYDKVAARANLMDLKRGGRGTTTTQDVMRHWLKKLPVARRKNGDVNG